MTNERAVVSLAVGRGPTLLVSADLDAYLTSLTIASWLRLAKGPQPATNHRSSGMIFRPDDLLRMLRRDAGDQRLLSSLWISRERGIRSFPGQGCHRQPVGRRRLCGAGTGRCLFACSWHSVPFVRSIPRMAGHTFCWCELCTRGAA